MKAKHCPVFYIGQNFEPMEQKIATAKERKEKEQIKKKESWVFRSDGASDFGQTVPLKRSYNYIKK